MSSRKPDLQATELFRQTGKAVHVITGNEIRIMPCKACSNGGSGEVRTNHRLNENDEWVCAVCGYNASNAGADDGGVILMLSATARLLGQMPSVRRWGWIVFLLKLISDECGPQVMQDIARWCNGDMFDE